MEYKTEAKDMYVPIFNQKLAGLLMFKGCKLIDMKPNTNNPNKNVFFFKDSKQVREIMCQYINSKF